MIARRASLPAAVWGQRQRWLRAILWAHVAGLALVGVLREQPAEAVLGWALGVATFAVAAQIGALPRRARSTAVALGLVTTSIAFVVLSDGAAAAWSHPFLVLVLLMAYEDWVLMAVAAVAAVVTARVHGGSEAPGEAGLAVLALVAVTGILAGRVNAGLRDAARDATERFRASFDSAPIGMAIVSLDGRFVDVNDGLCEIVGYPREQALELGLTELTFAEDRDIDVAGVARLLAGDRRTWQRQQRLIHAEGHLVWVDLSLSIVHGAGDADDYLIAQVQDVTERKRTLDELQHLADHDALSGLLNRRRLEHELAQQIAVGERYGHRACLVLLDLDDFKSINDSHGHAAGDELLRSIAEVLRSRVRRSDFVARLGGDEFAILLPQASREQVRRLAEGIARTIRERVHVTAGHELRTTASFGVATIAAGDTPSAVLLRADQAMYRAKDAGRDGVAVAPPPLPPGPGQH